MLHRSCACFLAAPLRSRFARGTVANPHVLIGSAYPQSQRRNCSTGKVGGAQGKPANLSEGVVIVNEEPEFEGENDVKQTALENGVSLRIPTFDTKSSAMGIQTQLSEEDKDNVERVFRAYMTYFDHIRFRKQWAEPAFTKEEITPLLRESADYVVRIRRLLDQQNATQKLRKVDGEAQTFLHSDSAKPLFKDHPRQFISQVVSATFKDAIGFVEGLNGDTVKAYIFELSQYQYNPRTHSQHIIAKMNETVRDILLPVEAELHAPDSQLATKASNDAALKEFLTVQDNAFFCPDDHHADGEWRAIIRDLYQISHKLDSLKKKMNEATVRTPPAPAAENPKSKE